MTEQEDLQQLRALFMARGLGPLALQALLQNVPHAPPGPEDDTRSARRIATAALSAAQGLSDSELLLAEQMLGPMIGDGIAELIEAAPDWGPAIAALSAHFPDFIAKEPIAAGGGDRRGSRLWSVVWGAVLLTAVTTISGKMTFDSASQHLTAEISKQPGVPAGLVEVIGALAAAMAAGNIAGSRRRDPPAEPPPPPAPSSSPNGPGSIRSAKGLSASKLIRPSFEALRQRHSLSEREAMEVRDALIQELKRPIWRDAARWDVTLRRQESKGKERPSRAVAPGFAVGLRTSDVAIVAADGTRGVRVALRISMPRLMQTKWIRQIRGQFERQFGKFISLRAATPIETLARTTDSLVSGASVRAEGARVGSVALVVREESDRCYAVSAGHVFADRNGAAMLGAHVFSPSGGLDTDSQQPIGLVAEVRLFQEWHPFANVNADEAGEMALVRIEVGRVPTAEKLARVDGHLVAKTFAAFPGDRATTGMTVFKATGETPRCHGVIRAYGLAADIHDHWTGQMLQGTGLLEVTLQDGPARLGDSGCLVCLEENGNIPLGIVVAAARTSSDADGRGRSVPVAYVVPFAGHPLLQDKKVL